MSPGSTLVTLRCTESAGTEGQLQYVVEGPPATHYHFRMDGPRLQVCGAQAAGKPGSGEAQGTAGTL